jgi:hypothetical protein
LLLSFGAPDLIILLKGLLKSIQEAPPDTSGSDQRGRLLSVITDGLLRNRS